MRGGDEIYGKKYIKPPRVGDFERVRQEVRIKLTLFP
jgi:hypothetical protein